MFKNNKNKNLITLTKYIIRFKTLDKKIHIYNKLDYLNENNIRGNVKKYILENIIYKKYLEDDYENFYPIYNIFSVEIIKSKEIKNVINKDDIMSKIFYKNNEIEIYNK